MQRSGVRSSPRPTFARLPLPPRASLRSLSIRASSTSFAFRRLKVRSGATLFADSLCFVENTVVAVLLSPRVDRTANLFAPRQSWRSSMAIRDEPQQSKESVFLVDGDRGGTPLVYRPETPALTTETILERSRERCEPVRLSLLDNVRRAANAAAGRLSATGRAVHDRATSLGSTVRAAARTASRLPAAYQSAPVMTAGAATIVLLVAAVVLAPRPRRTSLESLSPRSAALPALSSITATMPDPINVGTAGKRSAVAPRSGAVDGPVAAALREKVRAVHTPGSARRTISPGLVGSLMVDSKPSGADVWINGVPHGRTPLRVSALPVGSSVIRLELPGYERWSWAVNIAANKRTPLRVKLQPEHRRGHPVPELQ